MMTTSEPRPELRKGPEGFRYQATHLSVLHCLAPVIALVLGFATLSYFVNGGWPDGMVWAGLGFLAIVIMGIVFIPMTNYLEFTSGYLIVCEMLLRKQILWREIDPASIGCTVHTFYGIPLFTKIKFQTNPESVSTIGRILGTSVSFINLYASHDELIGRLQEYQLLHGSEPSHKATSMGSSEASATATATEPAEGHS